MLAHVSGSGSHHDCQPVVNAVESFTGTPHHMVS